MEDHSSSFPYSIFDTAFLMFLILENDRFTLIYPTSGKMLLSEHKKGNMFKAKTLIEKVGTRYLKQEP